MDKDLLNSCKNMGSSFEEVMLTTYTKSEEVAE